jgi:hypothetical protein
MAQNPHEYLIEQLQFTGDESVGSSSNKIKLNFNHPVKELIWVVQPDSNVDYCSSFECHQLLYGLLGAQPFNYTDAVDALPNAIHAFGGKEATALTSSSFINNNMFNDAGAVDVAGPGWWNGPIDANGVPIVANQNWYSAANLAGSGLAFPNGEPLPGPNGGAMGPGYEVNSGVSDAGAFVLAETALTLHCWGNNPVVTAKLQLNGQDRFSEREGSYFDTVQPYQHHTATPNTGINVYSFALRPEEHQPSGTCNFSRIDNATLQLVLSNATVEGVKTAKVRVYATNYNVLRVMSGMGGLEATCLVLMMIILAVNKGRKAVCHGKVSSYLGKPFMSSPSSALMI